MSSTNITTFPNEVRNILNVAEFNKLLSDYSDQLIVITFYTNTCPICKSFAPAFSSVQKEFISYKVVFGRANLEEMPLVGQQFNIMGVPTTIFVKNKQIIHMVSGGFPKSQFKTMVSEILKKFFNIKVKTISESDNLYL